MCGSGRVLLFLDCPCGPAGAAASGRSAQVTCPAASFRAPGDLWPGPGQARRSCRIQAAGKDQGNRRGGPEPPSASTPLLTSPVVAAWAGASSDPWSGPWLLPLPQAACPKPIPRSRSWSCGFDVRLKGCVFFPRGASHELLMRERNKAICKFLSR